MMDPLRSETCWSNFKYFIILIVSIYYILCIGWIIMCIIRYSLINLKYPVGVTTVEILAVVMGSNG